MATLILQAALSWGIPAALKIAEFWKASGAMTPEQAVDALTGILVEINAKTVDSAIADAEKRAGPAS